MQADGEADERTGVPWFRTGKARLVTLLSALVVTAWLLSHLFPREAYWIYPAATLAAVFPFGHRAVALARAGTPFSIETLMCAAALGAAEEAAVVVVLFATGELLENVAAGQARAGIRALASLIPCTARRMDASGQIDEVPAGLLRLGDLVQVRPGDHLLCDGEIVEGRSAVDESPITGESVPVARIVRMVEEVSASCAPTQRFIERFARWCTPGAMGAALLVILVPPQLFGGDWWT